jgi:antitoxin component of RelBE/YafQ-DinJ toxin-antitoxin module
MDKTVINIKTDKSLRDKAKKMASNIGIPLSTILNAYLRQFTRTGEVHFYTEGRLKPSVEKKLARLHKDVEQGKNLSPSFDNPEDALKYLHS